MSRLYKLEKILGSNTEIVHKFDPLTGNKRSEMARVMFNDPIEVREELQLHNRSIEDLSSIAEADPNGVIKSIELFRCVRIRSTDGCPRGVKRLTIVACPNLEDIYLPDGWVDFYGKKVPFIDCKYLRLHVNYVGFQLLERKYFSCIDVDGGKYSPHIPFSGLPFCHTLGIYEPERLQNFVGITQDNAPAQILLTDDVLKKVRKSEFKRLMKYGVKFLDPEHWDPLFV